MARKTLTLILVLVLLTVSTSFNVFGQNDYPKGDVNLSGDIDARDYLLLKRAYYKTYNFSEAQRELGDINNSGDIDARDYMLLKRMYFGTYLYVDNNTECEFELVKKVLPTCTTEGYSLYRCKCGEEIKTDLVSSLGHSLGEWEVVEDASISASGLAQKKCSTCKKVVQEATFDAHVFYLIEVVNPTCVVPGYSLYKCRCGCGEVVKYDFTPKVDHEFGSWEILLEATDEYPEFKVRYCVNCDYGQVG